MNKVIITGRLAKDPEISYDQHSRPICQYSLLVNRSYIIFDDEPHTDLINCAAYYGWAEFVEKNCKKGMLITVVGELQINSYITKGGRKQKKTEVVTTEHYLIPDHYDDRSVCQDSRRISGRKQQKTKTFQPIMPTILDTEGIFEVDDGELPF